MTKIWIQHIKRLFAYKIIAKSSCAFGSDLIWAIILHHPIWAMIPVFFSLLFLLFLFSVYFEIQFIRRKKSFWGRNGKQFFHVWTNEEHFFAASFCFENREREKKECNLIGFSIHSTCHRIKWIELKKNRSAFTLNELSFNLLEKVSSLWMQTFTARSSESSYKLQKYSNRNEILNACE